MPRRSRRKASPGRAADARADAAQPPEPGQVRARPLTDEVGAQLAGWGTVLTLETRGRLSGNAVAVAVGYLEAPDGSLLVAAGDPDADWARNLEAEPHGRVTIGDRALEVTAEALAGADAAQAIVGLILRYGTTAERLGRGPVFRLRPVDPPPARAG
jgi:deazaflavin-dependent oxidoreductase (nitroreductase family)